ncbi:MAG: TldD/PmbA family protein [Rickettsiales bacterium]
MNNHLDTLSLALSKAHAAGADAADAVIFESVDISASERLGKPEGLERSESKGLGLRSFVGKRQAIVSSTDMSKDAIGELAERVVAMAKCAPEDADSTLADASLYVQEKPALDLFDDKEPDAKWLAEQCHEAEETARAVNGITNSEGADASYGKNIISLGIARGKDVCFAESYPSSFFSVSVSVLAGEGTAMERDYDYSTTRHRADLKNAKDIGEEAAKRALKRLNPRKISTCKVPVVFDPRVGKGLLGIFASAASGSAIARGSSFLKDSMGKNIFPETISIIDDPHKVRGLASKPFDGEAVANQKLAMVENGTLQSWFLDTRTASKLGLKTTGHASRGLASAPSPSSSNLYIENGSLSPAELIKDIKSGFYVTETFGMGVNIVTGDYSQGASGFWIENGEIVYPVSELTIAGGLRDMFGGLTPANDLAFHYATNAPTLRVESMTVAGS